MVRQVRAILCFVAILLLVVGFADRAQAATYDVYDGNPSNTYIQYYRDIASGLSLKDNYVLFRSGQYQYTMVVGDIVYNNNIFTADTTCKIYVMENDNSYNGYYSYEIGEIDSLYLNAEDKIIYSDLGAYPQLEERGAKYEILTTILLCAVIVGYVCRSVFRSRPR